LYGLTVEEHTPLSRQILRGQTLATPDARYEDEYLAAHAVLGEAGFTFYEVSNAARPGREAVHNRAYWRRVPYLGLGPSAHSSDGIRRWWNEPAYAKWLELVKEGASPVAGEETLTEAAAEMERLYLGLRTIEGVELELPRDAGLLRLAETWKVSGLATLQGRRLALTTRGWLVLDDLVSSI